ncbi:MAG: hypothetical protein IJV98_04360 [Clostridia bacterium]|nr:hypothetical protein [Clostridia bacterium]
MTLKRITCTALSLLLVLSMLFSLCSCGSPESRFRKVEEKAIEASLDSFFTYYEKLEEEAENGDVIRCTEGTVSLQIGSAITSMLKLMTGMDFAWVNDLKVRVATAFGEHDEMQFSMGLAHGEHSLISLAAIMDGANGKLYASVPELFAKYLGIDFTEIGYDPAMLTASKDMLKKLPDSKKLRATVEKYLDIVLDSIEEVTEGETTLTLDGVSETLDTLDITLKEKDLAAIMKGLFTEAKADEDLKALVYDLTALYNETVTKLDEEAETVTEEEAYADFIAFLDDGIASFDESLSEENTENPVFFTMTDYLRGSDIVGRRIAAPKDDFIFFCGTVQTKEERRFELSLTEGEEEIFALKSDLGEEDGVLGGTCEFFIDGVSLLFVDIENMDADSVDAGYPSGSFTISPSEGLRESLKEIVEEIGIPFNTAGLSLRIDIEGSATAGSLAIMLQSGGEDVIGIRIDAKNAENKGVILPDESDVELDSDVWLKSADMDRLIANLRESELPDEIVELINSLLSLEIGVKPAAQ